MALSTHDSLYIKQRPLSARIWTTWTYNNKICRNFFVSQLQTCRDFFCTTALAAKVPAAKRTPQPSGSVGAWAKHHLSGAAEQTPQPSRSGQQAAHEYVGPFLYHSIWHSIKHVGTFANKRDLLALQQNSAAAELTQQTRGSGGALRKPQSLHRSKKFLLLQHAGM